MPDNDTKVNNFTIKISKIKFKNMQDTKCVKNII